MLYLMKNLTLTIGEKLQTFEEMTLKLEGLL